MMKEIEKDNTKITRSIGFLPSYLPNTNATKTNNTFEEYGSTYELNCTDSSKASKNDKFTATAPFLKDINDTPNLTTSEKRDITNTITSMRKYVCTDEDDTKFCEAEKHLLELLNAVSSRITETENEQFSLKLNNFRKERQDWIQRKKIEKYNESIITDAKIYLKLYMKVSLLIGSLILFFNYYFQYAEHPIDVYSLCFLLITFITGFFAFLYHHYKCESTIVYALDISFCLIFGFFYIMFDYPYKYNITTFLSHTVGVLYLIDLCGKLCLISMKPSAYKKNSTIYR